MSELKWNWAYYPYLDPPETQAESALKAGYIKVVNKSEADNVIAEKDKEIAKLKESIGKLLKSKTEQIMDEVLEKVVIYGEGFVPVEHAMKLVAELRHNKYKRCLAEAYVEWLKQMALCNYPESILYRRAARRERKWKEFAEKFKEGK